MSIKNAVCLALAGTTLLSFVLLVHLVMDGWGFFNGVVPVVRLGASVIRAFASVTMAVFLFSVYEKGLPTK